jgi:hypothetical protein
VSRFSKLHSTKLFFRTSKTSMAVTRVFTKLYLWFAVLRGFVRSVLVLWFSVSCARPSLHLCFVRKCTQVFTELYSSFVVLST